MRKVLLLALALTGCVTDASEEPSGPACTGKCDDATTGPIVSCAVTPDTSTTDPFFRADTLTCDYAPTGAGLLAASLQSASIDLQTTTGVHSSDRRTEAGAFTLSKLHVDAYPVEFTVQLSVGSVQTAGLKSLDHRTIKQHFTLASATETPSLTIPFDIWHVQIANRSTSTTTLALRHEIAGEAPLSINESVLLTSGTRTTLDIPVAHGAATLPVMLAGSRMGTLNGAGSYEIDASGALVPANAPAANTGAPVAFCSRTELGPKTQITCSSVGEYASTIIEVTPSTGAAQTLDLAINKVATFDGTVDAKLVVRSTISDSVEDLRGLNDKTFITSGTLTAASADLFPRLPFNVWRTNWTVDAGLRAFIDLPARQLDLGEHSVAVFTANQRTLDLQGTVANQYIVAPTGPLAAEGTVLTANGLTHDHIAVTIDRDATYHVTAGAITAP